MVELERHVSPDGTLTFIVTEEDDGDLTLGFEGYRWHTHGDLQAALSGLSEAEAIRSFIDELLNDKKSIVLQKIADNISDIWITDDVAEEMQDLQKYGESNETLEFRFWKGI
jgi:hypothetical protein